MDLLHLLHDRLPVPAPGSVSAFGLGLDLDLSGAGHLRRGRLCDVGDLVISGATTAGLRLDWEERAGVAPAQMAERPGRAADGFVREDEVSSRWEADKKISAGIGAGAMVCTTTSGW